MRARYVRLVLALLSLLGLTVWFSATPALTRAQQSADQVVLDLNHGAMDAYNNMDINRAGSMLEEALRIVQQNRLPPPLVSQTNVNMAIIYIGGLGDNDGGVKYFIDALCADPNVQLDPLTSTPDIQSVFQVAVSRVQQQGCPNNAAPNIAPRAAAGTVPMGAPPGPQQMPPQGGEPVPQRNMDEELPPGWGSTDTTSGKAKDFKRAFFQLGFALGMPWIAPGMEADRKPPDNLVFIHSQNGGEIADPEGFLRADPSNAQYLRFPGSEIGEPKDGSAPDYGISQQNAWEPDQNSYDGYTNEAGAPEPFSQSSCAKDDKDTGPPLNGVPRPYGLFPSKYCVRVNKPGFAPELALRTALGYFVTRDVSLALIGRMQFSAGKGSLSRFLVGARVEYMFTKTKPRGLMVSGYLGGTFGQIQAQPSASNSTGEEPWIKSGMGGAHLGANVRYRFTDNVGIFMAPELDIQFPSFLWNIDLTMLAVELSL